MTSRLLVFVLLLTTYATAQQMGARSCPDARYREAAIGGDTITGVVLLHKKPVKSTKIWVYDSSGKNAWTWATDDRGEFKAPTLPPGRYLFKVGELGSAVIELDPDLDQKFEPQVPAWRIFVEDNGCVSWLMTLN